MYAEHEVKEERGEWPGVLEINTISPCPFCQPRLVTFLSVNSSAAIRRPRDTTQRAISEVLGAQCTIPSRWGLRAWKLGVQWQWLKSQGTSSEEKQHENRQWELLNFPASILSPTQSSSPGGENKLLSCNTSRCPHLLGKVLAVATGVKEIFSFLREMCSFHLLQHKQRRALWSYRDLIL